MKWQIWKEGTPALPPRTSLKQWRKSIIIYSFQSASILECSILSLLKL